MTYSLKLFKHSSDKKIMKNILTFILCFAVFSCNKSTQRAVANLADGSGQLKWVDLLQDGPNLSMRTGDEKISEDLRDTTFKFVDQNIQRDGNTSKVVIQLNAYPCEATRKDWNLPKEVPMSLEGCHATVILDPELLNQMSPFYIIP